MGGRRLMLMWMLSVARSAVTSKACPARVGPVASLVPQENANGELRHSLPAFDRSHSTKARRGSTAHHESWDVSLLPLRSSPIFGAVFEHSMARLIRFVIRPARPVPPERFVVPCYRLRYDTRKEIIQAGGFKTYWAGNPG